MKLPAITFDQEALSRFSEVIKREWLVANGLGGYASSSVVGINTRKYHGLLVAALSPPGERTVCLSKLDEDVIVGNNVFRLGSNDFHDVIYPQGYKLIKEFSIAPYPRYSYEFGNIKIEKIIFMPKNVNAVTVNYKIKNRNNSNVEFRVFPLLTCRYFHKVVDRRKKPWDFVQKSRNKEFEIVFQHPQATFICQSSDGEFREKLNLVDRLFYRDEAEREESSTDDCFQPGYFELLVPALSEKQFAMTAFVSRETQTARDFLKSLGKKFVSAEVFAEVLNRQSELLNDFYRLHPKVPMSDWLNWILLSADSFVVENTAGQKSIIAGYHWFESWGRDTFVSLPGLLLVTGRFGEAKNILQNFIQYCKGGLIPNFITDMTAEPAYNTVDATFWYINAVLQYLKYTGDFAFVKEDLWEGLQSIIEYHQKGTLFGIHLDADGLVMHGSQLTWMDAAVDGHDFTPRTGKAVEIQALWYNALRTMELIANKFGAYSLAEEYGAMAKKTSRSFNEKFWNPNDGCLFDVLDGKATDASLRPNQIFAVSLDYTMLGSEKSQKVVEVVSRELLTPFGLRTLSLNDSKFAGKCFGNRQSRDKAYHNGTIWPWLLGPYVSAHLKVNGYNAKSRDHTLHNLVLPFFTVGIRQDGLGTINEIYDCDLPNVPRGCISQAWSVAEPLRAYIEDVLMVKPSFAKEILGI